MDNPPPAAESAALFQRPTNTTAKRLFVAGTRMNDGKTTTCLGLFAALQQRFGNVGFIKPVGQRFREIHGRLIDEDSILLDRTYDVRVPIESMSPIAIDGTFTRRYLENPAERLAELTDTVCRAFDRASWEKNFILIEGSGHAGVGSVFDLSNARVAKLLGAKAIIVARGGIGQPIDEIALNKALFDQEGVEVIGAIINKVQVSKIPIVRKYATLALDKLGIALLGLLPEQKTLASPSLSQVQERVAGKWLGTSLDGRSRRIHHITIGAMTAGGVLETLVPGTLLITPGDREDVIEAVLSYAAQAPAAAFAGIVLTRGIMPKKALRELIASSKVPVILAQEESYSVASRIHSMTVKTQPEDQDKIPIIKRMIQESVDLEAIAAALA